MGDALCSNYMINNNFIISIWHDSCVFVCAFVGLTHTYDIFVIVFLPFWQTFDVSRYFYHTGLGKTFKKKGGAVLRFFLMGGGQM